jgi:hypothetical protein
MGVRFNPFSGGLEIETEETSVYISEQPPADTNSLWLDTETSVNYVYTASSTGTLIRFIEPTVYNTWDNPADGDITQNLLNAKLGAQQKIYHNSPHIPKVPEGWVLLEGYSYISNVLNIIIAEWCGIQRVEYRIYQESKYATVHDGTIIYCPQDTSGLPNPYDEILAG